MKILGFSFHRSVSLVSMVLLGLALCGLLACSGEPEHSDCQEPPTFATMQQAMIDCKSRKDTGYVKGKAFSITVVTVDGKPVERETANAYYVMQQAAAKSGVSIRIVSGFRTMAQQQYLYNCYLTKKCNNGNLAARPGYSNHQSGHALDLNTSVSSVYNWLTKNGGKYGFKRTVPSEKWHWEWWGGGPGGGPCRDTCTPKCTSKTKFIGKDCKTGDCGVYGAYCANDKLGLRCYSAFCPALGTKKVCAQGKLGSCKDGKLTATSCPKGKTCYDKPSPQCVGANKPKGSFQKANCDGLKGWAQDPDQPDKAVKVKLTVNGSISNSKATHIDLTANLKDDALCTSLKSCNHGFLSRLPRSIADGKEHKIYAYTYDSETNERVALSSSPRTLQCPYVPPYGVLRHVSSPTSFAAWKFSYFWDVLPALDKDISALAKGEALPEKPVLVQADDGSPEVWVVDGNQRRHVLNPASLSAWRWTSKDVKKRPASEVSALQRGPAWPERPLLTQGSGSSVYMLDVPKDQAPPEPTAQPEPSDKPELSSQDGGTSVVTDRKASQESAPTPDSPDDLTEQSNAPESSNDGSLLVIKDNSVLVINNLKPGGCGCQGTGQPPVFLLFVLGLLFWVRRRRHS
ncbi:MAG: hypothetical protein EP343_06405 [Deltaproteobacteria bacterium]|nr:MAG: hypothetical protein EP343_06405 [Deltaproteobacteria bacterium]